jgi:hypothetical protein
VITNVEHEHEKRINAYCKIVNEVENDDGSDNNSNGDNGNDDIPCWTFAQNPESGDAILDEDVFDSIG